MQTAKLVGLVLMLTLLSACAGGSDWDKNYSVTPDSSDMLPLDD